MMTGKAMIAEPLGIHAVWHAKRITLNQMNGATFRWPRTLVVACLALLWLGAGLTSTIGQAGDSPKAPVALTQAGRDAGWRLLFDGRDPSQWRGFGHHEFPTNNWDLDNGCLHVEPHSRGGDLVSVDKFNDFELTWEWRISFGGNSGLKYLINEEHGPVGPEYQMIDDLHADDGKRGPKHVTGSLYDVIGASNVVVKPLPEFNQSRLLVRGKHVEHWLNGQMVSTYELESEPFKAAVAQSKFKTKDFFGVKVPGHILLQNHESEVWFRSLKIREIAR
jgi:hypothetical protein